MYIYSPGLGITARGVGEEEVGRSRVRAHAGEAQRAALEAQAADGPVVLDRDVPLELLRGVRSDAELHEQPPAQPHPSFVSRGAGGRGRGSASRSHGTVR